MEGTERIKHEFLPFSYDYIDYEHSDDESEYAAVEFYEDYKEIKRGSKYDIVYVCKSYFECFNIKGEKEADNITIDIQNRIKHKFLPFEYEYCNYGGEELFNFYNCEFSSDFGKIKKGSKFDVIEFKIDTGILTCYIKNPINEDACQVLKLKVVVE